MKDVMDYAKFFLKNEDKNIHFLCKSQTALYKMQECFAIYCSKL